MVIKMTYLINLRSLMIKKIRKNYGNNIIYGRVLNFFIDSLLDHVTLSLTLGVHNRRIWGYGSCRPFAQNAFGNFPLSAKR